MFGWVEGARGRVKSGHVTNGRSGAGADGRDLGYPITVVPCGNDEHYPSVLHHTQQVDIRVLGSPSMGTITFTPPQTRVLD